MTDGDAPSFLEAVGGITIVFGLLWAARHNRAVESALGGAVIATFLGVNGLSVWFAIGAIRDGEWLTAACAGILPAIFIVLIGVLMPICAFRDWRWRRAVEKRRAQR